MSYGLTIEIVDNISPDLMKLSETLHGDSLKAAAGGGAKRLLQDHFGQLDSSRSNALGGKRTHYFAKAARSINYETDSDGVTVSIHQIGIALHYFGGTVNPVNAKYLTIPARAEAYGKRAGEFDNLEVLWGRKGPYALAERRSQDINIVKDRRKNHKGKYLMKSVSISERGGGVFFWLVKSATIQADKTVLPDASLINDAAVLAVLNHIGENK